MRQNLDSYQASANKAEEDKMNLAFELKVAGNKRRLPLSPLFFPILVVFVGLNVVGSVWGGLCVPFFFEPSCVPC